MIGRLRGKIIERDASTIVVDVQGVGYVATVASRGSFQLGSDVDLIVRTHVRDSAIQLFGFSDTDDRDVFDLLITVPSVGPVKAMAILETPISDLVGLVVNEDVRQLAKLPGIGKRTAERMVVDLREKFRDLVPRLVTGDAPKPKTSLVNDVVGALVNLGFPPARAEREAAKSFEELGGAATLDAVLRNALAQLRTR